MSIIDTAKDVYALAAKGLTIDLQEKLMKLREQALELQEENLSLRTEVSSLRQKLDRKTELDFDGEVYKDSSEDAFCPSCYDKDGKLVRLHRNRGPRDPSKMALPRLYALFLKSSLPILRGMVRSFDSRTRCQWK
jgi:regulator of replication initiation timing